MAGTADGRDGRDHPVRTDRPGLGAGYFHNRRFPPFTPSGYIQWQNLTTVPELGLRAAVGGMVEIQASYEFINIDENTVRRPAIDIYGGGDARLFTKIYAVRERTWIPAMGVRFGTKLPNANSSDRPRHRRDRLLHPGAGLEALRRLVAAHLNLGIALLGNPGFDGADRDGQDDLFTYAVALVSPTLGARRRRRRGACASCTEVGRARPARASTTTATTVRAGSQVTYGGFTLYAGASAGLDGAARALRRDGRRDLRLRAGAPGRALRVSAAAAAAAAQRLRRAPRRATRPA